MGQATNYIGGMLLIIAAFFVFATMFYTASDSGGWSDTQTFSSFNRTYEYGAYFDNQSKEFRNTIENTRVNSGQDWDILEILRGIAQGMSLAMVGLMSVIDIGTAILNDMGFVVGIPLFFLGLAVVWLIFKIGSAIIKGVGSSDI